MLVAVSRRKELSFARYLTTLTSVRRSARRDRGAQAASLQVLAACQDHFATVLLEQRVQGLLSAGCRQLQAGSLRSPKREKIEVRDRETRSPALETSALPRGEQSCGPLPLGATETREKSTADDGQPASGNDERHGWRLRHTLKRNDDATGVGDIRAPLVTGDTCTPASKMRHL